MHEIDWRIVLTTKKETNARRVLDRVVAALGFEVQEAWLEPFRKEDGGFEVWFTVPVELPPDPRVLVNDVLVIAGRLSYDWLVEIPTVFPQGGVSFGAIASSRFTVSGVEWAHFHIWDHITEAEGARFTSGDIVRVSESHESEVRGRAGRIDSFPTRREDGGLSYGVWIYEREEGWMIDDEELEATGLRDESETARSDGSGKYPKRITLD